MSPSSITGRRVLLALAASILTTALVVPAAVPAPAQAVSVHVQSGISIARVVHVSFHARALPEGGYYYAVLVLRPYRHYTRSSPPPCSTSSNMQRADYGYPRTGGVVALALAPSISHTAHWCRGGVYSGAIYAVPHRPPCEGRYPCRSEPYEPPSPCWRLGGHVVCGVVALPRRYAYPDDLPQPLAHGTTVVAHFAVSFPA